jgi:glycosyltransferase involved in cell wall biosynthesis
VHDRQERRALFAALLGERRRSRRRDRHCRYRKQRSHDRHRALCRCDRAEREWRDDFAWARNQALEVATKRWILVLDADEQLEAQSKAAPEQLKNVPAFHDALWVRCYNESDDYQGTGAMSHVLVRVFPNDPRIRYRGLIHEYPTLDESTSGLRAHLAPVSIVHHGYLKDVVSARNKAERNLQIVREATRREPNDSFHWFNLGSTAFLCGDF